MRNPNRIDAVALALADLWKTKPDLRLGQLLFGFQHWLDCTKHKDIFYIEDAELIGLLQEYMERW